MFACSEFAFHSTYAQTGSLSSAFKAGVPSYFTGKTSNYIGNSGWNLAEKAIAHGVVGGTTAEIQGGKFGAVFVSAAFTKIVSEPIDGFAKGFSKSTGINSDIVGIITASIVGGTASELGGGKFSNGAKTAGMQYLHNHLFSKAAKNLLKNSPWAITPHGTKSVLKAGQRRYYQSKSDGTWW